MLKILVIDDSSARTELIRKTVMSFNDAKHISLTICDTADKGRKLLTEDFDLLILDILLPKKERSIPQSIHSVNLLSDINNPSKPYIRPGLIVGLTADIEELNTHQDVFQRHATVVLDGSLNSQDWLDTLKDQIINLVATQQKKSQAHADKILISVHGIRTYGQWQENLSNEIKRYSKSFESFEIKYGFFDVLSFSIPPLRNRKIKKITERLANILVLNPDKEFFFVAHSFGTLIVSEFLKSVPEESIEAVFLCASPLCHDQDIDHIVRASRYTVNDCGTRDLILVLARILVLGLGDAGRIGFSRENSKKFMNRYFAGGHSLYFNKTKDNFLFYERFWMPAITNGTKVEYYDSRVGFIGEDFFDLIIKLLTVLKPFFIILVIVLMICYFIVPFFPDVFK